VRVSTDAASQPNVSAGDQIEFTPGRSVKETEMNRTAVSAAPLSTGSHCFRLTPQGQACVDLVETHEQTLGSLSRYLHDVLMLCGTGVWFEQLLQFMPPRSLEESLKSLMALGLIEETVTPKPSTRAWRNCH
jgi:hypothetical protein